MNKKTFIACLLFGAFLSLSKQSFAQPDSILQVYSNNFQEERIYIHFDKSSYLPGETIWFKAYIASAIYGSNTSKNFYASFTDSAGNVLQNISIPIMLSSAKALFVIPQNFKGNAIFLKAYTSWMLNFDSAFIYKKAIPIVQQEIKNTASKIPNVALTFFPEGGNLINTLQSKVAFKANTSNGLPIHIWGAVYNNKGKLIDSIRSLHEGMGSFNITPQQGETYTVRWIDEWKNKHTSTLPVAQQEGIVMNVTADDENALVKITRQENATNDYKQLRIVATMHKQLVYRSNVRLINNNSINAAIPVKQLPAGILQITVFNANWLPIAERIFFVKSDDYELPADARIFRPDINKKAKNYLEINIPDEIVTNVSVSVTDADITDFSKENIISSLLLTSDIKGYVPNPVFYFSNNADSTKNYLDLVMLTHGWRKINWTDVAQNKTPTILYPKDSAYLSFAGKVFGATPSQLREAESINAIIKTKDSAIQFLSLPLKKDGSFVQKDFIFFDTITVMYQFNRKKDLSYSTTVNFDNLLLKNTNQLTVDNDVFALTKNDTTGLTKRLQIWTEQKALAKYKQAATLDEVIVKTKFKRPEDKLDAEYATGLFQGGDAYQIDMENNAVAAATVDVFSFLTGRVAGLIVNASTNPPSIKYRDGTPSLYLNEMLVDAVAMQSVTVSDIAYIKIIKPPFLGGGSNGSAGAIAVYTKKGKNNNDAAFRGLDKKKLAGYTITREFYSPDYENNPSLKTERDIRTTLYWNPFVLLGPKNRTVLLHFFNNDFTQKFRIDIQGMNDEGKLICIQKVVP